MAASTVQVEDYQERHRQLELQLDTIRRLVEPTVLEQRVRDLEGEMNAEGFWSDQVAAARVGAEHTRARRQLENYSRLGAEVGDVGTMLELVADADDAERAELLAELDETIAPLDARMARLQEEALFRGEYDAGPAVVSIQAGEGGVDAQDWAEMLVRMYLRFAQNRAFQIDMNSENAGEEAGIRSASFTVRGEYAYGVFNAEGGVHRLVRLSPFDSANRRQTSFAQVEVAPLFEDDVEVDLDESDIRVDTYRASGAGGQHVNKTDSAIRMTHLPTNIVVQCQNERSQLQNRETAMKMLRGKLYEHERRKREALIAGERGEAQNIGFGSQIRSYVMQPYQMVKDLRTRHETGNVQAVLDGDLDEFIRSYLLHRAHGGSARRDDERDDD